MKKITVIIVSYNVKDYLAQCLLSVQKALEGIDGEICIVDNHSRDNTVPYIRERFPEVSVIASNHNLGFSRANNMAIRQTESEYVLLLNPDTIVGESTLRSTLAFMDTHPQAGAAGTCMLDYNGSNSRESRRGLPTPAVAFYKMSGLCERFPNSKRFGHYYMGYLPWDKPAQIEVISGAFFLIRRKALQDIGLLDESFFMYGEDIDLSYRLLKGGYENWYLPDRILHYKGESTQKSSFRYVHVFYDAMLIFFRKHYSHASLLLTIPIKMAIYGKAAIALLRMQIERARQSMGFVRKNQTRAPLYYFIGHDESLQACRQLAQEKGLEALYETGDETTRPQGHLQASLPANRHIYAVYDTGAYSFDSIFDCFSQSPQDHISIGTYLPELKTIITTEEILK